MLTLKMKVQFVAAVQSGLLQADGRLISRGGTVGFVEADLRQEGKLVARGTATVLIRSSRSKQGA